MSFYGYRSKIRLIQFFVIFLFSFLLLFGCQEPGETQSNVEKFESGYVIYNLAWHGSGVESVFNAFFPSELKVYFSKPYVRMEMSTMGGVGRAVFLLNTKKGEGNVMVSVIGVRSRYKEVIAKDNVSFLFGTNRTYSEVEGADTIYMDRHCKYATSYIGTDEANTYRLIYAPEIGWATMNDYIPFNGVNGLVLSGSFCLGKIMVDIEAKELVQTELDPALFQVEGGYKEISRSAMEQLLGFGFK